MKILLERTNVNLSDNVYIRNKTKLIALLAIRPINVMYSKPRDDKTMNVVFMYIKKNNNNMIVEYYNIAVSQYMLH